MGRLVFGGPYRHAVGLEWRVRLSLESEIAAIDDQGGIEFSHPRIEIMVASWCRKHGKSPVFRVNSSEEQPVHGRGADQDRQLSNLEARTRLFPRELAGPADCSRQREAHRWRETRIIAADRWPDRAATAQRRTCREWRRAKPGGRSEE